MRRIASTALVTLLLALAPTGTAFSVADQAAPPAASVTVQAQDNDEDDDNAGLWGLLGLVGLAGLIPWRKNRGDRNRQDYRGPNTRSTGM
ncbi:WGxxGxxG family protein [Streptomyces sp. Tu 3180]|uniref:WGxxGxxG family protein n=1 Tax=Streptomyces sp. Tu 3180 TaxID=2682611 RepID=UPI001357D856|nr:WGxxGxxG family protein [Streptomyces sp. Tu 3180]KAF3463308.1 hypothetical protein GL259_02295 [Streptomyces sp. Tu 3180]